MARRERNADLKVQAKDCYDERDYILVHNDYFNGMRDTIRLAHREKIGTDCICIYCRHSDRAGFQEGEGL